MVGALRAAGAERPRGRARQPGAGRAHGLMRETLRSLSGYGGACSTSTARSTAATRRSPGAADFVRACRDAGLKIAFGTNNALLERDRIAARLQGMGIDADPDELVTAPDALAAVVQAAGHTHVVRLGNAGLRESLERVGIAAPDVMDAEPGDGTALALGLDPERSLAGVARAAAFVERRAGVRDPPSRTTRRSRDRGGTGTMDPALNAMSPVEPELCGKPSRHFGERAAKEVDRAARCSSWGTLWPPTRGSRRPWDGIPSSTPRRIDARKRSQTLRSPPRCFVQILTSRGPCAIPGPRGASRRRFRDARRT